MDIKTCHLSLVLGSLYQSYSPGRIIQGRIQDFPDEDANPKRGRKPTYYLGHLSKKKLHEIEKKWTRGLAYPAPPGSINESILLQQSTISVSKRNSAAIADCIFLKKLTK